MKSFFHKPNFEFSKKTKTIIGIVCSVLLVCLFIGIVFWGYFECFPNNERLVIDSIRLTGPSKFWNPTDPNDNYKRRTEIADALGLELGKTHMFDVDLHEYVQTLLKKFPSLNSASVYRELPNRIVFDMRERIPIASLHGTDAFMDEKGVVVAKNQYVELDESLPDIILLGENSRPILFNSGDDVSNHASLAMARNLIRTVNLNLNDIRLTQIVIFQSNSSVDCTFLYRDDPDPFIATFPDKKSAAEIENDLLPRLLSVLREQELMAKPKRRFNFRWDDVVVIPD